MSGSVRRRDWARIERIIVGQGRLQIVSPELTNTQREIAKLRAENKILRRANELM